MSQKLSSLVFNGPGAKTKTVLEMACKIDPKSSIIQYVSDRLGHFVSIYCAPTPPQPLPQTLWLQSSPARPAIESAYASLAHHCNLLNVSPFFFEIYLVRSLVFGPQTMSKETETCCVWQGRQTDPISQNRDILSKWQTGRAKETYCVYIKYIRRSWRPNCYRSAQAD